MISKEARVMFEMLRPMKASMNTIPMSEEQIAALKKQNLEQAAQIPLPKDIVIEQICEEDVEGEIHRITCDDKAEDHILFFIFGGGFENGDVRLNYPTIWALAREAKMDVFGIQYRQWPQAKNPAALEDCIRGFHWLVKKGYDPKKIRVYGQSAGAILTLTMTMYLRDQGEMLPDKISISSPLIYVGPYTASEIVEKLPSRIEREERDPMISNKGRIRYFEETDIKSPYASVIFGDLHDFPELQIHVGTEEILYDDAVYLKKMCDKAGVKAQLFSWDGLFHVFMGLPIPEAEKALHIIGEYLRK